MIVLLMSCLSFLQFRLWPYIAAAINRMCCCVEVQARFIIGSMVQLRSLLKLCKRFQSSVSVHEVLQTLKERGLVHQHTK